MFVGGCDVYVCGCDVCMWMWCLCVWMYQCAKCFVGVVFDVHMCLQWYGVVVDHCIIGGQLGTRTKKKGAIKEMENDDLEKVETKWERERQSKPKRKSELRTQKQREQHNRRRRPQISIGTAQRRAGIISELHPKSQGRWRWRRPDYRIRTFHGTRLLWNRLVATVMRTMWRLMSSEVMLRTLMDAPTRQKLEPPFVTTKRHWSSRHDHLTTPFGPERWRRFWLKYEWQSERKGSPNAFEDFPISERRSANDLTKSEN